MSMKKHTIPMLLLLSGTLTMIAQNIVKGTVINGNSQEPIQNVFIVIKKLISVVLLILMALLHLTVYLMENKL